MVNGLKENNSATIFDELFKLFFKQKEHYLVPVSQLQKYAAFLRLYVTVN